MTATRSNTVDQPPDPSLARTLDHLIVQLRQLKIWAGDPSYETIKNRVNVVWQRRGRPASELAKKSTVADCFALGRRRHEESLLLTIVEVLNPEEAYVTQWRQALRIIRSEAAASTFVSAQDRLPEVTSEFVGRTAELDRLNRLVDGASDATASVAVIEGMAGVGKTQMAIHAGQQLLKRRRFHAVLFVNLRGFHPDPAQPPADPSAVLDAFLRLLDVAGHQIPHDLSSRAQLYREQVHEKHALIVLDNAADADQVRPLLPDCTTCLTLITSRRALTDITGAIRLPLDVFTIDEAHEVLRAAAGERYKAEADAAGQIAKLLGYLPLALGLVASRINSDADWSLSDHLERLMDRHELRGADRDINHAIGELLEDRVKRAISLRLEDRIKLALDQSYDALNPGSQRIFRLLGLHPAGDLDTYAAAALANADLSTAQQHLDDLQTAHLLQQRTPGRYDFHDLVRAYATALACDRDRGTNRREALNRLLSHYVYAASAAMDQYVPHEKSSRPQVRHPGTPTPTFVDLHSATAWLNAERANLVAAATYAADNGWYLFASHISAMLDRYLDTNAHTNDAKVIHMCALRSADRPTERCSALHRLATVYWRLGRYDDAEDHYCQALTVAHSISDAAAESRTLISLGSVHSQRGRHDKAIDHYRRALTMAEEIGDLASVGRALGNLGVVHAAAGRFAESLDHHLRALDVLRQVGDRINEGRVLGGISNACHELGRYEEAIDYCQQALVLSREIGDRYGQASALNNLGHAYFRLGHHQNGLDHSVRALAVIRDAGDRTAEGYTLRDIGLMYLRMEHYGEALKHLSLALDIAKDVGERSAEADALNGIGEALRRTGSLTQAIDHFRAALAVSHEISYRIEEGRAHEGIGNVLNAHGDGASARTHWQQALLAYTELGIPEGDRVRAKLGSAVVS